MATATDGTEATPAAPSRSLFRRYTLQLATLVVVSLLATGTIGLILASRDMLELVDEVQREKAAGAAARITQFIASVETQVRGAALGGAGTPTSAARQFELLKLMRLVPAIAAAAWIDGDARERMRVSRIATDRIDIDVDRGEDAAVQSALQGGIVRGPVVFRRESEPHLLMIVPALRSAEGVIEVELNLKFAADVLAGLRLGESGFAYLVDDTGRLLVHPEPGRMLDRANVAYRPQVRAALAPSAAPTVIARDEDGRRIVASYADVAPLGWRVIVEQPAAAVLAPLARAGARTALLLVVGVAAAIVLSLLVARRLAAPIRTLRDAARRIGEGQLDERVAVRTGDELETLGMELNRAASKLRDAQTGLEAKVAERTAQLEEANRAKVRFIAAASHDLRQPVHALGLFAAQLAETDNESDRRRLIEKVGASSSLIADLIDSLLDLSRLDAGAIDAQPVACALQPLFDRVDQAFAPAAAARGLRFRVRTTALRAQTDPVLLERILMNLCANAIRYTADGGVIVAARRRGGGVRVEVRDTGIGIRPEERQRIFEEFYQAPSAPGAGSQGLGLGLAIVERLARLLAHPLHVASTPGRGSLFAVDLPAAPGGAAAEPVARTPMVASQRFDSLRVLVIEDDPHAREATEGVLRQWGCDVRTAESGAAAHRVMETWSDVDLLLCDYRLGSIEVGTDVARRLRATSCAYAAVAIVSADLAGWAEPLAKEGMHVLRKPLQAARLRALLQHVAAKAPAASSSA